jgi:xanthine dehydrogenase small subunit
VAARAAHPQAVLLAGSTDVGLWVTKQMRELTDIIYLGHVEELKTVREHDGLLEIGAGVSLNDAYAAICAHYPELAELWQRFASLPIRNAGTLGGNVANGSPIGDSMPWLIALGAASCCAGTAARASWRWKTSTSATSRRICSRANSCRRCAFRCRAPASHFRTYKLAKRFDQDISAVCAAFALDARRRHRQGARIAFGGMAATPKRAALAEAALLGRAWDEAALQDAMAALAQDYAPLSDMRASNNYRMQGAQNLLRRFWLETRLENPLPAEAVNVFAQPSA